MWFGKGSQVQPEESLAEKVQFCISSFILRGQRTTQRKNQAEKQNIYILLAYFFNLPCTSVSSCSLNSPLEKCCPFYISGVYATAELPLD